MAESRGLGDVYKRQVQGDADSLAGLLLELKGDFLQLHEKVTYKNYTFEVLQIEERRISKVKVILQSVNVLNQQKEK